MASRDEGFKSDSSSSGRRQRAGPSSLESDDVDTSMRHRSHVGNSSQDITPHLPIDSMRRELGLGGVIPLNVDSTTQLSSDPIGHVEEKLASLCLTHRTQQPSDSIVQSTGVPGVCGSVQQPDDIDDTLHQLRCAICYMRWLNLVIKTCRHLNCDVCYSKGPSFCGICRGEVSGLFPIRFHSARMIEDIDIPTIPENQRDLIKTLMEMGFQRAAIRRAIRQTSDGLNTTLNFDAILEILVPSEGSSKVNPIIESTYSIPTPEELEHILEDPKANPEDQSRLREWLQITAKCLICKDKPPCLCLLPCHHLAICLECYEDSKKRPQHCPDSYCGEKIGNQVKVHF